MGSELGAPSVFLRNQQDCPQRHRGQTGSPGDMGPEDGLEIAESPAAVFRSVGLLWGAESGGGCGAELGMRGEGADIETQISIRMWVGFDFQG